MIRVAAVGDVHVGGDGAAWLAEAFGGLADVADVLLLAGDLTRCGEPTEARLLAEVLGDVEVPVVAVLGNHDHHAGRSATVVAELERRNVCVLEGDAMTLEIEGTSVGIAGAKGFGGGFTGSSGSEFGEAPMKEFIRHSRHVAESLGLALQGLSCDVRIALTHYSPVRDTLRGESPEIYPFLGSYHLAEAIDQAGAALAVHGHAHHGREHGLTDGGVPVRNVAEPVLMAPYRVYGLDAAGLGAGTTVGSA